MFGMIQERKQYVVVCKGCREWVPAGQDKFPFQSVVVVCPLCEEKRQYRPSEISLGRISPKLIARKK